jgi:hypothetical protein
MDLGLRGRRQRCVDGRLGLATARALVDEVPVGDLRPH